MMLTAGLLVLFVAGAWALPGEPFLKYDPVSFSVNNEEPANQDEEGCDKLGVDFIKMPDNAEKGYKLYKFVTGLQRNRELHLKSPQHGSGPLFTSSFLDLWVDHIPSPDVPRVNHAYVGSNPGIQSISNYQKKIDVPRKTSEVKTCGSNGTEPKLFFTLLLNYNQNIHYIFFFVIEHDYNVLTNLYYLRS